MTLRVLVADGRPETRARVRALLAREPDTLVVGECAEGPAALDLILRERPDLVLLDPDLPELDGFGVLEAVGPQAMPLVVFVTARGEHAVQAFDVQALDCLVQPVLPDRFRMAVRRARAALEEREAEWERETLQAALHRLTAARAEAGAEERGEYLDRLMVRSGDRALLLRADEIDWIGAEGNYAELHVGPKSYLIRETMGALEEKLDPAHFLRVHRSAIVNLDRVREMRPAAGGDYLVTLKDGTELRLSRGYRARLEKLRSRIASYL